VEWLAHPVTRLLEARITLNDPSLESIVNAYVPGSVKEFLTREQTIGERRGKTWMLREAASMIRDLRKIEKESTNEREQSGAESDASE